MKFHLIASIPGNLVIAFEVSPGSGVQLASLRNVILTGNENGRWGHFDAGKG